MNNKKLETVKTFDCKNLNPDIKTIEKLINSDEVVNLVLFTCSTISSEYMFDTNKYYLYVNTNPEGNNLEADIQKLSEFLFALGKVGVKYKLTIFIGNTDPYYIYSSSLNLLPGVEKKEYFVQMNTRWEDYRKNLETWLKEKLGSIEFSLLSWFSFETRIKEDLDWDFEKVFNMVKADYKSWFDSADLTLEIQRLSKEFGPNKYFQKLDQPSDEILEDWIISKFCEYAIQGFWIYMFFPNVILLQNEKPSDLRYKMYQPLIKKCFKATLPNLYPFGVDNLGYM
jgi:hypothetical protein